MDKLFRSEASVLGFMTAVVRESSEECEARQASMNTKNA